MRIGVAVALLTCGLLLSEITLTRIFSVTLMYHYAFLVLSVTLCGLSGGGILRYLFGQGQARVLGWYAAGAALSLPLSVFLSLNLPLSPYALDAANLMKLALVVIVSIFPFLFCGLYLSYLYSEQQQQAGRIYAFDLAGAAGGCLAAVSFLEWVGAPDIPWVAGFFFVVSALLLPAVYRGRAFPAAMIGVLLVLSLGWAGHLLRIEYVKGRVETSLEFEKWNAFSRIAVMDSHPGKLVQIDADAATEIVNAAWLSSNGDELLRMITGVVYRLRQGGDALIIGPGGGRDVAAARMTGSRVVGVEINPIIVQDLMLDRYYDLSGRLYRSPGVEIVVGDGRSFLERSPQLFDVIQGNGVDTWAATSAGGFTLSESYLYTVEAFEKYLDHLQPDGILSLGRWVLQPPQQMLRIVALALEAMERRGIGQPEQKIFLLVDPSYTQGGGTPGVIFIKKQDFTAAELTLLHDIAAQEGFQALYSPGCETINPFADLIRASDRSAFFASYPLDVRPTTDDRPFFFFTLKWQGLDTVWNTPEEARKNNAGLFILAALFSLMLLVTGACFILPLCLKRSAGGPVRRSAGLFFLSIGLAFMMAEAALIQKTVLFVGHPTYAFTVVVAALLLGAGCGSLWTGRVGEAGLKAALARSALLVAALVGLLALGLTAWLQLAFAWELPARILWLALPVFLLGITLGRLFPLGLRYVRRAEVPWAWALNGVASVLGSILAVLLAMHFGFSAVLLISAGLYLVAGAAVWRWQGS